MICRVTWGGHPSRDRPESRAGPEFAVPAIGTTPPGRSQRPLVTSQREYASRRPPAAIAESESLRTCEVVATQRLQCSRPIAIESPQLVLLPPGSRSSVHRITMVAKIELPCGRRHHLARIFATHFGMVALPEPFLDLPEKLGCPFVWLVLVDKGGHEHSVRPRIPPTAPSKVCIEGEPALRY